VRVTPQAEDSARLQKLFGDLYAERIPREEMRSAVFDVILERLRCARVSMWKFEGSGDELALVCFATKPAGGEFRFETQGRLHRDEFIHYFNGLVDSGIYMSADAMNDPALQPMREHYLIPHNVVSMLDAAVIVNNRTYGMVCCEEPYRREWQIADSMALRAIINKISLLMWNAPEAKLLNATSLPLRAILSEPEAPPPDPRRR
jgi:hypothetical protein